MKTRTLILAMTLLSACATPERSTPPVATKKPVELTQNGDTRVDNYYWMRERESAEVIDHLEQENAYTRYKLKPIKELRQTVFAEMKGRMKKNDSSVPAKYDDYYYYKRYEDKSEHPIIARKKGSLEAQEEIILDVNELADGEDFFQLGGYKLSPNHNILAYATDTVGRRIYTIHFRDLETGKELDHKIEQVTNHFTFAEDDEHLFYTKQNPTTLRFEWIRRFNYKTGKDILVFHEKDNKFYASVSKSKSKKFIFISTESSESSEVLFLPANQPNGKWQLFNKREKKHEYSIDDAGKYFIVRSNKGAENFKVMRTSDHTQTSRRHWKPLLGHRKTVLVSSARAFQNYFIFGVRKNGLREIEILNRKSGRRWTLPHPEKSYVTYIDENPNFDLKTLRYSYESMTTPSSVIDYHLTSGKKEIKKTQEVLGDFDAKNYNSERIYARAKDGTRIPISVVYRKGTPLNGTSPTLLYGYGSYGMSMEPWFSSTRLSLLDRGFVFAIAHIRGGSEMGRKWYLNGKFRKKKNTFTDFIAAGEHMVKKKYASPEKLYAMGGSAGGLLMGAVMNMRPDLFKGIVAQVPFVDVLTTMLDESLPLTTNEFEEWGNPKLPKYYGYMKSYSPYDNIQKTEYPPMLVSSGLHDSQVQYWEPTKWVAKLREYKTDQNLLLLDTNMEAGHGGKSGRFKKLEDRARDYAFLLHLAGIKK